MSLLLHMVTAAAGERPDAGDVVTVPIPDSDVLALLAFALSHAAGEDGADTDRPAATLTHEQRQTLVEIARRLRGFARDAKDRAGRAPARSVDVAFVDSRRVLVSLWDEIEARGHVVRRQNVDHLPDDVVRSLVHDQARRVCALIEGDATGWTPGWRRHVAAEHEHRGGGLTLYELARIQMLASHTADQHPDDAFRWFCELLGVRSPHPAEPPATPRLSTGHESGTAAPDRTRPPARIRRRRPSWSAA